MPITLDRDEAILILEEIAREAQNAAARIAAIKQLEDMRSEEVKPDADLYSEEFQIRRKGQIAA